MMKLLAAAALAVSCFAVPTLPVSAAPLLSDAEANCLILPVLKSECWQMGADRAEAAVETIAAATEDAAEDAKLPWWTCTRAADGAGYLLEC
jgi:hypothetical protein